MSLANDLGEELGSFAVLSQLRRVRSGSFTLEDAVTIDQLKKLDSNQLNQFVRNPVPVSVG